MNQQFRHRQFPAGNPLANALVVIAGILIISLSLVLGFMVFVAFAGFVLVMAIVMSIRNWWLRRKLGARGEAKTAQQTEVIEGEYHIVVTEKERDRKP